MAGHALSAVVCRKSFLSTRRGFRMNLKMQLVTAGRADPTFHWSALIANKDREIARLEAAYTPPSRRYNVALVKARAVLEDAHTVRLATGASVRAKTILISTERGRIWGRGSLASSTQSRRTKRFICPNCRDASWYRAAGILPSSRPAFLLGLAARSHCSFSRGENILRGFDDDVREHLRNEMRSRGITVTCGHTVTEI